MQVNDHKYTYFAADDAEQLASYMTQKSQLWFDSILENNYLEKIRRSWNSYHGAYYTHGHSITYGGEQGELVNLPVNHYRNIARHILTMVTANRPAFQSRSTNTDYKSQTQTLLANGLLDYYMREKKLETYLKKAVEYAIVLGAGYVKMEWNATRGEIYDYVNIDELDDDGELKQFPIYEGDVEFVNLSPLDVVFDSSKESSTDHDWVLCRTFKNKFDLAAKYPDLEDKILELQTKSERQKYRISVAQFDDTQDVPVYEFFHKRTEALPEGRYVLYLSDDIILMDTEMPYRDLPVYRISAGDMLGTPFGYTEMFDLLPIQDAVNALYSTIMSNQNAFGVQNILNPRGNDISVQQVSGGLNFIEYNPLQNSSGGRPEPLNLTQTPPEIFNFVSMLEKTMETVSGVNSVARGNPESSLKSGTALALVQSQALQFMSGLQQSYIMLIENIGTGLINLLRDFATVPRVAAISGQTNKTKMMEFTGDDLSTVNRVIVDAGNALAQCLEKNTPVLMADGSTKMVQDIVVGDKVMGPDSKPRTVGNVNVGVEEMFRISPKNSKLNDLDFTCNASHILTLKYCSDDNRYGAKKGDIKDISVREYLRLTNRERNLLQGFTTGVEFEEKEVLVDPYIVGSWLGDGHSACPSITSMDSEIISYWKNFAEKFGMELRKSTCKNSGRASSYFITSGKSHGSSDRNPVMNEFRRLELIDNKHIPELYLHNSRKVRLQVLAGLLDTDGSLVDQTFVFTQKDNLLTEQIKFLAKSLGFRVNHKKLEVASKLSSSGFALVNKLTIGGNTWEIPTKLERKQPKKCKKQKNWNNFGISVESKGLGEYYGFTLIEEPHFVLGNFVVTHNTTAGRVQIAEQLLQMKLIDSPEKFLQVINTGKLSAMTESQNDELLLIKSENEALMEGSGQVKAIATDHHALHIREHKAVLNDTQLRLSNPQLAQDALDHINEHLMLLRNTDPGLLAIIQEQPLPPIQGTPANVDTMSPDMPNPQGMAPELQNVAAAGVGAGVNQPAINPGRSVPAPAQPAQSPDGNPVLPTEVPLVSGT